MSSIYKFDVDDAKRFASEQGIEYRVRGDELQLKYCPYCRQRTKDKNTFAINMETGMFKCLRASCGAHGNMITLSKDFNFSLGTDIDEYYNSKKHYRKIHRIKKPVPKEASIAYMESRGISKATTEKYNITSRNDNDKILVFPFYDENDLLQFVKYRKTDFDKTKDKNKEWCEANCKPILFGMNQCDPEVSKTLILTEGQIDSLSVTEAGLPNAVSVPTGAKGFTWVPYCWDFLNKFDTLIIFGDHENGHITLLEEMKYRFPHGVIKHVRPEDYQDCKDANELLQKHGKAAVKAAVENAVQLLNPHIEKLAEVRRIDPSQLERFSSGIQNLDRIIGGMFMGQLVLLTGERGKGKSTLASQLGIMGIKAGYNVFYYSGELTDWNVQDWFERQIAGAEHINKRTAKDGYESYSVDQQYIFKIVEWYREHAYLYNNNLLMEDSESNDSESLLKTFEKAIAQNGCRVLIVDNLMTALEDNMQLDLYRQQTRLVTDLAKLAKRFNVLVILVAHPRKENGYKFSNDSISGSSNITNLCDVVLRYDEPSEKEAEELGDPDRVLQVWKNRMTGRVDKIGTALYFQESSKRISESSVDFDLKLGWDTAQENDGFMTLSEDDEIPF